MAKTTTSKAVRKVTIRKPSAATSPTGDITMTTTSTTDTRKRPKVASARQIQDALETIQDDHLVCRDVGHSWRQYTVRKAKGGFERSMFCRQCKTARHQFVSNRGEILSNQYSYVEGYQFRGLGRIVSEGKALVRLETIGRALDGQHTSILEQPSGPIGKTIAPVVITGGK